MGKVEKFVKKKEAEKHINTAEFIEALLWYIQASEQLDQEWAKSKSDLNEAFNERIKEIREAKK